MDTPLFRRVTDSTEPKKHDLSQKPTHEEYDLSPKRKEHVLRNYEEVEAKRVKAKIRMSRYGKNSLICLAAFVILWFIIIPTCTSSLLQTIIVCLTLLIGLASLVNGVDYCSQKARVKTKQDGQSIDLLRTYDTDRKAYNEHLRQWETHQERLREPYWREMDGWQFEKAIADLYAKQGYTANVTPGSGDHGVDIHLRLNDKLFVVQCKQQVKTVSPHIVRDLFGTMHSERANGAILVCTGGFSEETIKWAADKPIQLIGMPEIQKMVSLSP